MTPLLVTIPLTAADIQRVARQYFTAKNRTVATLVPEKPEVKQ